MGFSLRTLWRALRGRAPRLACSGRIWRSGVAELRRRAGGRRESGAFLLGSRDGATRRIEQFLYYDDVDPHCFDNGIVEFNGALLGRVWILCRELNMSVVADVHVHPGHYGQSASDRANPIMPEAGHLALILPGFAATRCVPGAIGMYEYLGSRRWQDHSRDGERFFRVERFR
jgi:hypothetical protein